MSHIAAREPCPFCSPEVVAQSVLANSLCYLIWTDETGTPEGSTMVLPLAHRETIWDLTADEWAATQSLLHEGRDLVSGLYAPDGWNVGWNVGRTGGQTVHHVHCHLLPRYRGEPLAGRGIRSWIKDPANRPPR